MNQTYQLTRHPLGSIKEMWTIAWPLIVGLLSASLMLFADRLFLARYSVEALTASANAGTMFFLFIVAPITITGISEVFVGQYHGNNEHSRLGEPVWQMLWFSLFLLPFYLLAAKFLPPFLFNGTGNGANETAYFSYLMIFAPFFCAAPALMGFFAGQGRVKVITVAAIICNLINIVLDPILIFWFEMGIKGAALATGIAEVAQIAVLATLFLLDKHGTAKWAFKPAEFLRCIKVGLPAGIAHTSEILVIVAYFQLMISAGPYYIVIASVVQSFFYLVCFVGEGLSKAVTAIASNLIGAKQYGPLRSVITAAFKLHTFFSLGVFAVVLFFPEAFLNLLFATSEQELIADPAFLRLFRAASFWMACFFLFDGWMWSLIGFLTAAKDTKFVMIVSILVEWLFYFPLTYAGVKIFKMGVDGAWMIVAFNSLLLLSIYFLRVKSGSWKEDEIPLAQKL